MGGIIGIFRYVPCLENILSAKHLARLKPLPGTIINTYSNQWVEFAQVRAQKNKEASADVLLSSCKQFCVAYNGSIYNLPELKKELADAGHVFIQQTDEAVIMAAYEQWGVQCASHFYGAFSVVIWDTAKKALFVVRDRCGESPLYYTQNNGVFYCASALKALVPFLQQKPALNLAAVDMFLHYQYVPEPFTLINGVHVLPAAHYMQLFAEQKNMVCNPVCYWQFEDVPALAGNPTERIKQAFQESMQLCLRSDQTIGLPLSGGIDSGTIAAFAAGLYKEPMQVFSIGYPGRPAYDEREQAKGLAQHFGLPFQEVEIPIHNFIKFFPQLVKIMDSPIADPAAFAHYIVPKTAAECGIQVLLSGVGGDELFWGYPWVSQSVLINEKRLFLKKNTAHSAESCIAADSEQNKLLWDAAQNSVTPENQLVFLGTTAMFAQTFAVKKDYYGEAMQHLSAHVPFLPTRLAMKEKEDIPLQVLRLLFDTWLVSNCLSLAYQVGIPVGVETRMPFLDARFIEVVMGVRKASPDHTLPHKARLCDMVKGMLPDEVLGRPKKGFQPPVAEWTLGVIKQYGSVLKKGQLVEAGIISKAAAKKIKAGNGEQDWCTLFFAYKLILLEMWFQSILEE